MPWMVCIYDSGKFPVLTLLCVGGFIMYSIILLCILSMGIQSNRSRFLLLAFSNSLCVFLVGFWVLMQSFESSF